MTQALHIFTHPTTCMANLRNPSTSASAPTSSPNHFVFETIGITIPTYEFYRKMLSYNYLEKQFPWATMFRAGVIIVHRNKILIVKEMKHICYENSRRRTIRSHWGFPKGARKGSDVSAVDTALRETEEETCLSSEFLQQYLMQTMFIVPRLEVNIDELHCYFLVHIPWEISMQNKVRCADGICDFKWTRITHQYTYNVTARLLIRALMNCIEFGADLNYKIRNGKSTPMLEELNSVQIF